MILTCRGKNCYFRHILASSKNFEVFFRRPRLNSSVTDKYVDTLYEGLKRGNRACLASSITLVESVHPVKRTLAQKLLTLVLRDAKENYIKFGQKSLSFRIGISGPPGAGKSTFIESFGKYLTSQNNRIAVLAVDPSSSTTGGSLLGDKTRMTELTRDINAYIRPSPTGGFLGGVTRSTSESVFLCECSGYNIVFVETVGVGQSEYQVADMVDMFVLLIPPAGGDELQGIKRGIVELADLIVINKADGDLLPAARKIQAEYTSALKFSRKKSKIWKPRVMAISSRTQAGIPELWKEMNDFWEEMLEAKEIEVRRRQQRLKSMWSHIESHLLETFKKNPNVKKSVSEVEQLAADGVLTPGLASDKLIDIFTHSNK